MKGHFSDEQKLTQDGSNENINYSDSYFCYRSNQGNLEKNWVLNSKSFQAACLTENGDPCLFPFKDGK